jgi:competence protein ComEC
MLFACLKSFYRSLVRLSLPPSVPVTLAFMAGIGIEAYSISLALQYGLWVLMGGAIIIYAYTLAESKKALKILIVSCCSFVGGSSWTTYKLTKHRAFLDLVANRCVTLEGTVVDRQDHHNGKYQQILTVAVDSLRRSSQNFAINREHSVKLYIKSPIPVDIGDALAYEKLFCSSSSPSDPKRNRYLIREGLSALFFVNHSSYTLLERKKLPFENVKLYWARARYHLINRLRAKLEPATYSLFTSLFLGSPTESPSEIDLMRQDFTVWGIAHYLARSGLHVAVMLTAWSYLLRYVPFGLALRHLALLGVLLIFTLLSWTSVSFARAVLTYSVARIALILNVQAHPLHILALTCFLTLGHNPFHLFFLNFQLSFGLAWALAWISELELRRQRSLFLSRYSTQPQQRKAQA